MKETKITFDAADDYERFMGRWSRAIGEKFLAWLDPPRGARWLDVGCGTGAFSELILRHCTPQSLVGIDPSPAQIEYVRRHFPDATFQVATRWTCRLGTTNSMSWPLRSSSISFRIAPRRSRR